MCVSKRENSVSESSVCVCGREGGELFERE